MPAPMIVHQYAPSPHCEKLRRVLVRLEIPFTVKDYLPLSDEERATIRELADRAQHNQMPVLERDGQLYGDSFLITQMLLQEYPERAERIYPADPVQRTIVYGFETSADGWWLRPEGQHLTPEYCEMKGPEHAARIVAKDRRRRDIVLHTWNEALERQAFLTGDSYNMADIAVISHLNANLTIAKFVQSATEAGMQIPFDRDLWPVWEIDAAEYPALRRWHDACNAPEFTDSAVAAG